VPAEGARITRAAPASSRGSSLAVGHAPRRIDVTQQALRALTPFSPSVSNTHIEHAARRLKVISKALAIEPERQETAARIVRTCMQSWGPTAVGDSPTVLSDITDDHTPFEFSLGFRPDSIDLRFLVEARPATPKIEARWEAGLALLESLRREHGCDIHRFRAVADLFAPADQWARFSMWHAVNIGKKARFKIYLNPAANGTHSASPTVRAALRRLGLADAWSAIPQLRSGLDEVKYFSLDLVDDARARVKVYFSHRNVDVDFLEMMLARAPGYVPGTAESFCRKLSGGRFSFDALPVQTCYSFVGAAVDDVALHFPVRSYARHDGEALERVSGFLNEPHRSQYRELLTALTGDPSRRRGVQTYASLWAGRQPRELTVYLSPQLYASADDDAKGV
jgi:hypothetical protein